MRSATFDVPATMESQMYSRLRDRGFVPACRTQVPSEWHIPEKGGAYLQFTHVGGYVEAMWSPLGKGTKPTAQMVCARNVDAQTFKDWLAMLYKTIINDLDGTVELVPEAWVR